MGAQKTSGTADISNSRFHLGNLRKTKIRVLSDFEPSAGDCNSRTSGIRTIRSPSPQPSPSGRGSIVGSRLETRGVWSFAMRSWLSLSLRGELAVEIADNEILQLALEIRKIPS